MKVGKLLFSEKEIETKVHELAQRISQDYAKEELLCIGILKGAFMFFPDLVRRLSFSVSIDFIAASSYKGAESSGKLELHSLHREPIEGRHILLVEDIIDTGASLHAIREILLKQHPASLECCTLLSKKIRRLIPLEVKYKGFEIDDQFAVGYGLDWEGKFRNLPSICSAVAEREEENPL